MLNDDIKVLCKRCKKQTGASKLTLDPVYKMMVCPDCVKERTSPKRQQEIAQAAAAAAPKRPRDWDADDVYLEQAAAQKAKEPKPSIERISEDKVKYTCVACRYTFTLTPSKNFPSACPMCNTPVSKFRL